MPETKTFTVPDLGEGLVDATLTEWYVAEGDVVELNQPLCSLATAKAEVEIPSPFAGRVDRLHGAAGDTMDVGSPLVAVAVATADPEPSRRDVPAPADPGAGPVLVGYGTSTGPSRRIRRRSGALDDASTPAPPGGPTRPDADAVSPPTAVRAKPPVRALARRLGVDLVALVPGSGPGGIVTRGDVEAAGRSRNGHAGGLGVAPTGDGPIVTAPRDAPPGGTGPDPAPTGDRGSGGSGGATVPLRGVRAVIAARMAESRRTIPEAWCGRWVDATGLVALVDTLRASSDDALGAALTPFALMLRYVVAALGRHPVLNATIDADAGVIRLHDAVHLGVAVADERGLIVPVVRHAERLATGPLALETRRLIDAVRRGAATPTDLSGSTFTVSNFGALGLDDGNPIINVGETAILGVGAIRPRPAVVDGVLAVRSTAKITCAFDHRVCDGAEAGGFLRDLARMIEHPERAVLDL
jgi:2-oxoisovalerate dehydrogenase E2 component (dihydrolipoyl transacylase)